ncbi:MAG: UDP-N-acetylglucosamine 2-epimerase, partial [Candidatus Binatia bacterium]
VMAAIAGLATEFADIAFLFPVHLNPNVRGVAKRFLGGLKNVHLCEPLDYGPFAHLLQACHFVMTDSGGIQEEAAELGKPVLVMRRKTERNEGISAGTASLVGVDPGTIQHQARNLLNDSAFYRKAAIPARVYGNGTTALEIANILETELKP